MSHVLIPPHQIMRLPALLSHSTSIFKRHTHGAPFGVCVRCSMLSNHSEGLIIRLIIRHALTFTLMYEEVFSRCDLVEQTQDFAAGDGWSIPVCKQFLIWNCSAECECLIWNGDCPFKIVIVGHNRSLNIVVEVWLGLRKEIENG